MQLAERVLGRPHPPEEPLRVLGLSVSSLIGGEEGGEQLELDFDRE
jgi:DNA polymerase-4